MVFGAGFNPYNAWLCTAHIKPLKIKSFYICLPQRV
jgi:hypothetical protein